MLIDNIVLSNDYVYNPNYIVKDFNVTFNELNIDLISKFLKINVPIAIDYFDYIDFNVMKNQLSRAIDVDIQFSDMVVSIMRAGFSMKVKGYKGQTGAFVNMNPQSRKFILNIMSNTLVFKTMFFKSLKYKSAKKMSQKYRIMI